MLKLLLFLWMPLSIGIIQGLGSGIGMGMTIQHLIILSFVFVGCAIGLYQGALFSLKRVWFYLSLSIVHFLLFFYSVSVFIKLLAVVAIVQWTYVVANNFTFKEFVSVSACSSMAFFLMSAVFIVVFPDASRQYFWGDYMLSSFYVHKNSYGRFLFICFTLCFFYYLINRRYWVLIFIGMISCVMLLSGSRSSLVLSALVVLIYFVVKFRVFGAKMFLAGLVFVIAFFAIGIANGNIYLFNIGSALDGIKVYGVEVMLTGRATIWSSIFYQLTLDDKWLFGYGLDYFFNNYEMVNQAFGNIGLGVFMPADSHNGYVDTLLSYGVVGLLVWFALMLSLLLSPQLKSLSVLERSFVFIALVAFISANMTESFIVKSTNYMCFLFYYLFFKFLDAKKVVRAQ